MASQSRFVLSHEHLDIEQIEGRRQDTEAAIEAYFAIGNPGSAQRFLWYTPDEVRTEKEVLIKELRRSASMDVFGALEAAFQIDFLQRCYRRKKDDVSRAFQSLDRFHREKNRRVPLPNILTAWRENSDVQPRVIEDLKRAFKYRHWLAHGRYWNPMFQLDYDEVYTLAERTLDSFPFEENANPAVS